MPKAGVIWDVEWCVRTPQTQHPKLVLLPAKNGKRFNDCKPNRIIGPDPAIHQDRSRFRLMRGEIRGRCGGRHRHIDCWRTKVHFKTFVVRSLEHSHGSEGRIESWDEEARGTLAKLSTAQNSL